MSELFCNYDPKTSANAGETTAAVTPTRFGEEILARLNTAVARPLQSEISRAVTYAVLSQAVDSRQEDY